MISLFRSITRPIWAIFSIVFWTSLFWGVVLGLLASMFFFTFFASGLAVTIAQRGHGPPFGIFDIFFALMSFATLAAMVMVPFRLPLLDVEINTYKEWKFDFALKKWSELE